MCVYVHASVLVHVCALECVACQLSSNFLSTCARLNCFLYVIDLHLMGTLLSLPELYLCLCISILSTLVYMCDSSNKASMHCRETSAMLRKGDGQPFRKLL